jgi:hypothetical protein
MALAMVCAPKVKAEEHDRNSDRNQRQEDGGNDASGKQICEKPSSISHRHNR